jgi:hypothetical protein
LGARALKFEHAPRPISRAKYGSRPGGRTATALFDLFEGNADREGGTFSAESYWKIFYN